MSAVCGFGDFYLNVPEPEEVIYFSENGSIRSSHRNAGSPDRSLTDSICDICD